MLLGAGDGTFRAATFYGAGISPQGVVIGDLNGDQVPDLAVANAISDNVAVLPGGGNGTFGAISFFGAGNAPSSLVLGDLDGDSVPDIGRQQQGGCRASGCRRWHILLAPVFYPLEGFVSQVAIGDLNGDHVDDLAIADNSRFDPFGPYDVAVLLGLGNGMFGVSVATIRRSLLIPWR